MKTLFKLPLYLILLCMFLSLTSSTKKSFDPDVFGKTIYKLISKGDYKKLKNLLITKEDLLELNSNSIRSEKSISLGTNEIEKKYNKWKSNLYSSVDELEQQVKELSIDFKNASLESISYQIKKEENIVEGEFYLKVIEKNNIYQLSTKGCLYSNNQWTLLSGIKIKLEQNE